MLVLTLIATVLAIVLLAPITRVVPYFRYFGALSSRNFLCDTLSERHSLVQNSALLSNGARLPMNRLRGAWIARPGDLVLFGTWGHLARLRLLLRAQTLLLDQLVTSRTRGHVDSPEVASGIAFVCFLNLVLVLTLYEDLLEIGNAVNDIAFLLYLLLGDFCWRSRRGRISGLVAGQGQFELAVALLPWISLLSQVLVRRQLWVRNRLAQSHFACVSAIQLTLVVSS